MNWIKSQWWLFWFRVARWIMIKTGSRSVVNHANYWPLFGKVNSWAYVKHCRWINHWHKINLPVAWVPDLFDWSK